MHTAWLPVSPRGTLRPMLLATLLLAALTAACELVPDPSGPTGTQAPRVTVVAEGLEVPWGLAFLPGGDILVTERPGRLRLIAKGRLVDAPVATPKVSARAESGLLGLALHPRFADNRQLYLYYTLDKGRRTVNRVERYRLSDDGRRATPDRVIVDDIPSARFHDGGRLRFGPDGRLYAGTGDATEPDLSQDVDSLAGKILRVNDDGSIPEDNPWPGKAAYVMGVRNVQGFDWLPDGRLLVADHGPSGERGRSGHDEVSVARGGDNLGWPTIYGCEERGGLVTPLITFARALPPGGAAIVRGEGPWRGDLVVGVLGARQLRRFVVGGTPVRVHKHEAYFKGDPPQGLGRLRDVVSAPDGKLYVTTSNCDGRGTCGPERDRILRLDP